MARLSFSSTLVVFSLAFLSLPTVSSFWIISHHPLVSQRLDPIISPNGLSSHVHAFVGSKAIKPNENVDSSCTTSPVKADKSKYWAPQLYYYHGKNQTFSSVPLWFTNTYYLNRNSTKSELKAFPDGFKMIAGNASLYDAPAADKTKAKAVSFVCLGVPNSPQTTTLPNGPCPGGIRTQIVFPSCWDGKNLDSADHTSHVSYPLGGQPDNGDCPSSHPVKFMTLFYEFIYSTKDLQKSADGKSGFVLANGDAVGHSFHGDFVAGWDEDVLQKAIDQCTFNLFGNLKGCAPFLKTLTEEVQGKSYCTTKSSVDETVLGDNLKSLPGCQVVKNGPFKGAGSSCSTGQNQTSTSSAVGTTNASSSQVSSSTASDTEGGSRQGSSSTGSSTAKATKSSSKVPASAPTRLKKIVSSHVSSSPFRKLRKQHHKIGQVKKGKKSST
ncbi:unnamed protein product [Sympodiomycopsis kandeliae]